MKRDPSKFVDQEYDVVVIGGGIYGACILWDAAQRGLSAALVEKGDFGQETSANSLKTVHGGLRYLQDFDFNLVRSMIEERSTYLRIAPHLVQPLACITPTYSRLTKSKVVMGTALKLSDLVGFDRNNSLEFERSLPSSRLLSKEACQEALPGIPVDGVSGAAQWYDAQIYDTERLTLAFVASAVKMGADVCNYVEAAGFLTQGNQVNGIKVLDTITGGAFEIRSKVVVNATGPGIDSMLNELHRKSRQPIFQPSLAINIITREIVEEYAAGVPSWPGLDEGGSNQAVSHMLFVSPWRGNSIIGTFHSHFQGDADQFSPSEEDLLAIIRETNSAYPAANLSLDDIRFVHYGLLPEKSTSPHAEVKLIRKSKIIDHQPDNGLLGLISVMGVKYTTARQTAEKVVDLVFKKIGRRMISSRTHKTQISGGQIDYFGDFLSSAVQADSDKLAPETIEHWVRSYGSQYTHLKDLLVDTDDRSLLSPLSDQVISAQVRYAVREEMAITLSDVIFRRTGIGTTGQPGDRILETAAEVMASELGWSAERAQSELEKVVDYYRKHGGSAHPEKSLEEGQW